MNWAHRRICSSRRWAKAVAQHLPKMLAELDLGDDVLEIGPGFGATTRVLVDLVPRLTALEVDEASAELLRREFEGRATIVHGDGTAMPFPDRMYSGVVCFTMLHHVPSAAQQDRLFGEAFRVLRPAGVFGGTDSQSSLLFRLLHLGDTMVVVDPGTLPSRLEAAGFTGVDVDRIAGGPLRFRATRAGQT